MFKLLIFILILIAVNINSNTYDSWLNIKNQYSNRFPVERANDGAFIEFLYDWINGPTGFWSQELLDRGFDDNCWGELCNWKYINHYSNIKLVDDMYNENGLFGVYIKSTKQDFTGIEQEFFYDDTTKLNIYIYAKLIENPSKIYIQILNLENIILQEEPFELSNEFKKYEFQSGVFNGNNKLKIRFVTNNTSEIVIDEASVMPSNNVFGIRNEIYTILKRWNPGILRYPGGWFVDSKQNKFENGIGDIDKRKSPLKDGGYYQRMDFGYHEYFKLIKDLGSKSHIGVNFAEGTPEEAAILVEYLNGDSNSEYGKLRSLNGDYEPFNVEWWEVGNEQWDDVVKYSEGLKGFYDKMKETDKSIKIITDGNMWGGLEDFNIMDSISEGKFDLYGFHAGLSVDTNLVNSGKDTTKMGFLGLPFVFENYSNNLLEHIKNKNKHQKIGNTEWSIYISNLESQVYDVTDFTSQFQNGLYNAMMISFNLRNSDNIKMCEKTAHIGSIQRKILDDNKRLIYPKPPVIVSEMIQKHLGKEVLPIDIHSAKYNAFGYENMIWMYDVPFTDFTVTATDDTTFVYIINRNIHDSVRVNLNSNLNYSSNSAKVYTYYQESLEAVLTPENIHGFDPKETIVNISDSFIFPPHSFSILALPTTETLTFSKDENIVINQIVSDGILATNIIENIISTEIYNVCMN